MKQRKMICDGRFYPSQGKECVLELEKMFASASEIDDSKHIFGGIVPHAGWIFSGNTAAKVFQAIYADNSNIDTFILLGACHCGLTSSITLSSMSSWQTPLAEANLDIELIGELAAKLPQARFDDYIHNNEHSIEVNIPFVQHRFPNAKIVPIIVPHSTKKDELEALGLAISEIRGKEIAVIGSTDLTHYGSNYRFNPAGSGKEGLIWAKNVNDKSMLKAIEKMDIDAVIDNAKIHQNACGGGAIAATIAACRDSGAQKATILEHITSNEIMQKKFGYNDDNGVGYAAVIFTD